MTRSRGRNKLDVKNHGASSVTPRNVAALPWNESNTHAKSQNTRTHASTYTRAGEPLNYYEEEVRAPRPGEAQGEARALTSKGP